MKRHITIMLLGAALLQFPAAGFAASASTDSVTGLALYPGAGTPDNTLGTQVCTSKAKINTYDLLPGRDAAAVGWFASHLHGFTHTHLIAIGHTQDMFLSNDGKVAADVTGNMNGSLYGVSYERLSPPLSAKQRIAYGKSMLNC